MRNISKNLYVVLFVTIWGVAVGLDHIKEIAIKECKISCLSFDFTRPLDRHFGVKHFSEKGLGQFEAKMAENPRFVYIYMYIYVYIYIYINIKYQLTSCMAVILINCLLYIACYIFLIISRL